VPSNGSDEARWVTARRHQHDTDAAEAGGASSVMEAADRWGHDGRERQADMRAHVKGALAQGTAGVASDEWAWVVVGQWCVERRQGVADEWALVERERERLPSGPGPNLNLEN
jgi:hypothetical protein